MQGSWKRASLECIVCTSCPKLANCLFRPWMSTTRSPRRNSTICIPAASRSLTGKLLGLFRLLPSPIEFAQFCERNFPEFDFNLLNHVDSAFRNSAFRNSAYRNSAYRNPHHRMIAWFLRNFWMIYCIQVEILHSGAVFRRNCCKVHLNFKVLECCTTNVCHLFLFDV